MFIQYRNIRMSAATSETTPAAPANAPAVSAPVVPPSSPATPPSAAAQALPDDMKALIENPELFKSRLSKEREVATKSLVKDLGFEKIEDAKAFFAEARKEAESKKTEAQRIAEKIAALEPQAQRAAALDTALREYLASEEKQIPAEHLSLLELAPPAEQPEARLAWISKAKAQGRFNPTPVAAAATTTTAQPANTRAGLTPPPTPAPANSTKHPRDMTPDEFKRYEAQRIAEHTAR